MKIVGLPDATVKESKERVLSSMQSLGGDVSEHKIVVKLSPSEQKKNGPFFDLAMGIVILKERGELKGNIPEESVFTGALALDGAVEKVERMLHALIAAKSLGFKRFYLPYDPLISLEMQKGLECVVVQHIQEVVQHLSGTSFLPFHPPKKSTGLVSEAFDHPKDFLDIIGHEQAKQAFEIAAEGEHNLLMSVPSGYGKSLFAETFPSILPPLAQESQLGVTSSQREKN